MEILKRTARTLCFLLKVLFKKSIIISPNGKKSQCSRSCDLNCDKKSEIYIGKINALPNVHIGAVDGGKIYFGDNVFLNRNCIIVSKESIKIGDNCSFGPNVCIYDHDHTFGRAKQNGETFRCKPVSIGSGCWIGANVTILKGTQIGDNCVIGAGCVISGTIPANTLVKADRSFTAEPIE